MGLKAYQRTLVRSSKIETGCSKIQIEENAMKLKYKLLLLYVGASLSIMLVIGSFLSSALKDTTIDRIARNYRQQLKHIDFGLTRLIKDMEHDLEAIAEVIEKEMRIQL